MKTSHYEIALRGLKQPFRVIQISDVHFSVNSSHKKNMRITEQLITQVQLCGKSGKPELIAVTGDLISRKPGAAGMKDAVLLMKKLRLTAPVLYTLGNHETDLPVNWRKVFLRRLAEEDIAVLHNRTQNYGGIAFTGLVLPQEVYKSSGGSYFHLRPVTSGLVTACVGLAPAPPCVLLAHNPMGFPAYAEWGADAVLSGHVHGGIVRVPGMGGILSPERRFFPAYTKGVYTRGKCRMVVSAGIGKMRVNNPPEVVCVDFIPSMEAAE